MKLITKIKQFFQPKVIRCMECGGKLHNKKDRERGMSSVCWHKYLKRIEAHKAQQIAETEDYECNVIGSCPFPKVHGDVPCRLDSKNCPKPIKINRSVK